MYNYKSFIYNLKDEAHWQEKIYSNGISYR